MTQEKATANWSSECPTKADAGDAYYFVRRKDRLDVVVMGFSMGKGWLNGVSYESSEMRNHLFLGPITPELFVEVAQLREQVEFAISNGHKWTLEDWANWIENHAKPALAKER